MADNPPVPKGPAPPPTPSGSMGLPKAPTRQLPGIRRAGTGKVVVTLSSVAKPPPAGTQSLLPPPPIPKVVEPPPRATPPPFTIPGAASATPPPVAAAPTVSAPPKVSPITSSQLMKNPPPLPPKQVSLAKPLALEPPRASATTFVKLPPKTTNPSISTLSGKTATPPSPQPPVTPPATPTPAPEAKAAPVPVTPAPTENPAPTPAAAPISAPSPSGVTPPAYLKPAATSSGTATPPPLPVKKSQMLSRKTGAHLIPPIKLNELEAGATTDESIFAPADTSKPAEKPAGWKPLEPGELPRPQGGLGNVNLFERSQRLEPTPPKQPVIRPGSVTTTAPLIPPSPLAPQAKEAPSAQAPEPKVEPKAPEAKLSEARSSEPKAPVTKTPQPGLIAPALRPPTQRLNVPLRPPTAQILPATPVPKAVTPLLPPKPVAAPPTIARALRPPSQQIIVPSATPKVAAVQAKAPASPLPPPLPVTPPTTAKARTPDVEKLPAPVKSEPPTHDVAKAPPPLDKTPRPVAEKLPQPHLPVETPHEVMKAPPLIEQEPEPIAEKLPQPHLPGKTPESVAEKRPQPHLPVEVPHEVAKAPPLIEKEPEPIAEKLPQPHLPGETPKTEVKPAPVDPTIAKPAAVRPAGTTSLPPPDRSIMSRTSSLAKSATEWLKKSANLTPPPARELPPPTFDTQPQPKPEPRPALKAPVLPKRIAEKQAETAALPLITPAPVSPATPPAMPSLLPAIPAAAALVEAIKAPPALPVELKETPKQDELIIPPTVAKPVEKEVAPAEEKKAAVPAATPPPLPVTAREKAPETKPPEIKPLESKSPEVKAPELKPPESKAPQAPAIVDKDKPASRTSQLRPFELPREKETAPFVPLATILAAGAGAAEAKTTTPETPGLKEIPILAPRSRTTTEPPVPVKTAQPKTPKPPKAPKAPATPKPDKKIIPLTRAERAKRRRLMETLFFWAFFMPLAIAGLVFAAFHFGRDTRVEGQVIPPPGMALSNEVWIVTDFSSLASGISEDLTDERLPIEQEIQERQEHVQRAQADVAAREERIRLIQQEIDSSKAEIVSTLKESHDSTQAIWDGEGASIDNEYEQKMADLKKAISDRAQSLHLQYAPDESFQSPEVWANAYRLALYQVPSGVDTGKEHQWLEEQMTAWRNLTKSLDDRKESLREKAAQIKLAPGPKIADLNNKIQDLQARIDSTLAEEEPLKAELQQAQSDLVMTQAQDANLDDKYYKQLYALPEPSIVNHIRIPVKPDGRFTWIEDTPWLPGETEHHYWIFSRAFRPDGRQYWALHEFKLPKNKTAVITFEPGGFNSTKAILRPNLSPDEQEE